MEIIATFMALLEMIARGEILLKTKGSVCADSHQRG